jgi:hypothetical protein
MEQAFDRGFGMGLLVGALSLSLAAAVAVGARQKRGDGKMATQQDVLDFISGPLLTEVGDECIKIAEEVSALVKRPPAQQDEQPIIDALTALKDNLHNAINSALAAGQVPAETIPSSAGVAEGSPLPGSTDGTAAAASGG